MNYKKQKHFNLNLMFSTELICMTMWHTVGPYTHKNLVNILLGYCILANIQCPTDLAAPSEDDRK